MRIRTSVDQAIARVNNISKVYDLGEPIPVPAGKDIYIQVPAGVYRCNFNEGLFPEDRRFIQPSEAHPEQPHVVKYSEIAHLQQPTLSIKSHYPGEDRDIIVEFK